jgi:hypothetical protein
MGLPEMRETGLFNEVIGNLLARKVGVDTPEPVLVHLSQEFVEASHLVIDRHDGLKNKGSKLLPGYGAGCEFLSPGLLTLERGGDLTDNQLPQAMRIYAFDLMVQNIDRSFESDRRPNCGYFGNRLVAYDFEMCFSFVLSLFNPHKAWEVSRHRLNTPHIFYSQLRKYLCKQKVDFRPFINDLAALDLAEVAEIMQNLPQGWGMYSSKVKAHLHEVISNHSDFELELNRSLV